MVIFFFVKQKTAYEMRISDWSSDVCSSDLAKGDQAVFGDAGEASEFAMRCDADTQRMVFTRAASGGTGATMQIIAANGAATFYTEPGPAGRVQACGPATDTFLTGVMAPAKDRLGVDWTSVW